MFGTMSSNGYTTKAHCDGVISVKVYENVSLH